MGGYTPGLEALGEAGAVEIKWNLAENAGIIGNLLNSMKRCRIIGGSARKGV